jgi:hypothetical protein
MTPFKSGTFTGWTTAEKIITNWLGDKAEHKWFGNEMSNMSGMTNEWMAKSMTEAWCALIECYVNKDTRLRKMLPDDLVQKLDDAVNSLTPEAKNMLDKLSRRGKYEYKKGQFDTSELDVFSKEFFRFSDWVGKNLQISDTIGSIIGYNYFTESFAVQLSNNAELVRELYGEGVTRAEAIELFKKDESLALTDYKVLQARRGTMTNTPELITGYIAEAQKRLQDRLLKRGKSRDVGFVNDLVNELRSEGDLRVADIESVLQKKVDELKDNKESEEYVKYSVALERIRGSKIAKEFIKECQDMAVRRPDWDVSSQERVATSVMQARALRALGLHYTITGFNPLMRITLNLVDGGINMMPVWSQYKMMRDRWNHNVLKENIRKEVEPKKAEMRKMMDAIQEQIAELEVLGENVIGERTLEQLRGELESITNHLREVAMEAAVKTLDIDVKMKENFVRGIASTALTLLGLCFAAMGKVSGSGSSYSREEREQLEATGWRPHSVKVGGSWVSYRPIPLHAFPFSFGAEWVEGVRNVKRRSGDEDLNMLNVWARGIIQSYGLITNLDFISSNVRLFDAIVNGNERSLSRIIGTMPTRPLPPQWNITKFFNDCFDSRWRRPETVADFFLNENRVLFHMLPETMPSRYNVFGERIPSNTHAQIRGRSGVAGTIGWALGFGSGYASIRDRELLDFTQRVLEMGERVPASNGRVTVRVGGVEREMTWRERETFFRVRGKEYSRLIKLRMNRFNSLAERAENGDERARAMLKQELQGLHRRANETGRRAVESGIRN